MMSIFIITFFSNHSTEKNTNAGNPTANSSPGKNRASGALPPLAPPPPPPPESARPPPQSTPKLPTTMRKTMTATSPSLNLQSIPLPAVVRRPLLAGQQQTDHPPQSPVGERLGVRSELVLPWVQIELVSSMQTILSRSNSQNRLRPRRRGERGKVSGLG